MDDDQKHSTGIQKRKEKSGIGQRISYGSPNLSGVRVAVESIRKERKRQGITESSVRISRRQMISYVWKRKSRLLEEELQLLEQSFKMYPSLHSFHQMVQTFREAFDERNYPAFFKWLEKQLSSPNNHLYDYALRLRRDLQSIKLAFSTVYGKLKM